MKLLIGSRRLHVNPTEFWSQVAQGAPDACWRWLGKHSPNGYGKFYFWRSAQMRTGTTAHRVAYALRFGPFKASLVVDHLCNNKSCVNPAHLKATTNADNVGRAVRRTHCPKGHAFTRENTYINNGRHSCRACGRVRALRYYHRSKDKNGAISAAS